ncbi:hypothetical protein FACS1894110_22530 [Spirochaetia bacterium]|nr:hypothetical protein FACS1894110_22530 [Spirochaetia bacterium]
MWDIQLDRPPNPHYIGIMDVRWLQRLENYKKDTALELVHAIIVDVSDYNSLQNENLKDHIRRVGKIVYEA